MDAKDTSTSLNAAQAPLTPLDYASPGIKPVRKFRPLIVAGLVIVIGLLLWSITIPATGRAREAANRVISASNLRQIGQAILLYTNDFQGKYPDTLSDLLEKEDITSMVFIAPADTANTPAQGATTQAVVHDLNQGAHCSYVYIGQGLNSQNNIPPDVVICFEQMSVNAGKGMNVLFADGHVDWVDANGGNAIMAQVGIGNKPVRWPIPASTMPAN